MKRLIIFALAALLAAPTAAVTAQEGVDIPTVAERVSAIDSERLLMGLNTPIPADMLPGQFSEPDMMDKEALSQQRSTFNSVYDNLSGSMVYTVEYAPSMAATPDAAASPNGTPQGSPENREPQALFTSATITYLLFTEPIDMSDPDAFGATVQQAMGSEAVEGDVQQITLGETPAIMISTEAVINAVEIHANWIAVPVGNVLVIGMVMTGADTFSEDAFIADNEALVLSGIAYLGEVAGE